MKRNLFFPWQIFVVAVLIFTISACQKDYDEPLSTPPSDLSHELATQWMTLLLKLTKETAGFTPPVAARAFGYIGLTLYESVQNGIPGNRSLAGQLNGLKTSDIPEPENEIAYHWGLVANAAMAEVVKGCYANASAENLAAVDALKAQFETEFKTNLEQEVYDRSVAYGKSVGTAMLTYANSDGQAACYATNFPTDYVPPVGDGLWKPTPPAFQRALQPYWGDVRPFLGKNVSSEVIPGPPPPYSDRTNSTFWEEMMEVYNTGKSLTNTQLVIANYWSDDPGKTATPPGHSISILIQVLEKEDSDLAEAAEAFAKVGMGVHDAFVSCWKTKFKYNYVRPISVILEKVDSTFTIPLTTPPFPEYTSGHSVQSGAAAQILSRLFGNDYAFTDRTHEARTDINGAPRSFNSFFEFADEAAISRLYGGIHFRTAIDVGVSQGKKIGTNINNLKFRE